MEVKPEGKQDNEQPMDASMIDQDQVQGGAGSQSAHLAGDQPNNDAEDPELEAIKARVREMEEEAAKLKQIHEGITQQIEMNPSQEYVRENLSAEEKIEVDNRSIYVGNVDYSATADDLEQHFHGCGSVNRVTILCDKYSGHPKGFAYIEFADKDSVQTAMALDDSLFKGRLIKVSPKRTNRPGLSSTHRGRARGRGSIARGGFGSARGAPWGGPFRPTRRPRGRGAWFYQPY